MSCSCVKSAEYFSFIVKGLADTIAKLITERDAFKTKLEIMTKALEKIAACRGYITGDVVKIAKDALAEEKEK